jgi:hypothetical protein
MRIAPVPVEVALMPSAVALTRPLVVIWVRPLTAEVSTPVPAVAVASANSDGDADVAGPRREEVHACCAPDVAAVGRDIDAAAGAVRKDGVTELAVQRKVVYARNGTAGTGDADAGRNADAAARAGGVDRVGRRAAVGPKSIDRAADVDRGRARGCIRDDAADRVRDICIYCRATAGNAAALTYD